jgi:hypothetical protein
MVNLFFTFVNLKDKTFHYLIPQYSKMDIFSNLEYKSAGIRKFYFLEYFYILLFSINKYEEPSATFECFKTMKEKYQLGESKYRLSAKIQNLEGKLENRYKYTFNQVLEEAISYELTFPPKEQKTYQLTSRGKKLLDIYNDGNKDSFYNEIFKLIEEKTYGFNYLVQSCYRLNPNKGGLLIFPIYSPLKLGFEKSELSTKRGIVNYMNLLKDHLEADLEKFLNRLTKLETANQKLLERLIESNLIAAEDTKAFDLRNYNLVIKRIRDYWLGYFLRDIYNISYSFSYFDLWSYRARYLGIINTTEFYPNFNGRIVYPISILSKKVSNNDFNEIFQYPNAQSLFVHEPSWSSFQDAFITTMYNSYHDLKRSNRSYFINLQDLREIVCFKTKISYDRFVDFLTLAYNLNLKDELRIKISLEADKLPDETNAIYMKREPILIDGKQRNIIAIDLKK